ncbi:hypothetical protein [Cylindrospermopsis raciborskii]|uniref:hypothetical protein n=1 Tax=Cylindrospermopsis raciborskii TaxID=77022 RepID=UPI002EDA9F47
MQNLLAKSFEKVETYLVISTSFEGLATYHLKVRNLAGMIPVVLPKDCSSTTPELADWL